MVQYEDPYEGSEGGAVRFGGSIEEETALRRFAEILGAEVARYEALEGEEPLLMMQCLLGALKQITRWVDGAPPLGGDAQNPLPGLDTPPCR